MVVDKIHEKNSFKQSKWSGKKNSFNTQKQNRVKMNLIKTFINYLITQFVEKQ